MSGWRTPARGCANGNCVEVRSGWRKSSRSMNGGNCVAAGNGSRTVLVRDTADRGGPVLTFPAGAWAAFTDRLTGA